MMTNQNRKGSIRKNNSFWKEVQQQNCLTCEKCHQAKTLDCFRVLSGFVLPRWSLVCNVCIQK